ncbi:hypothetical protein SG34_015915 [Thalassomonas viridans]|uniref:Uncharacterized protein n=1 Tax=Thalassomonas viridans TaxID=137584 RepID=A0AAE9Z0F2_9GAMM|nr:hypothetical protein [Thalassomonas viridans]WDE02927.1 hypothetical protein SG34_015915 [Thalassomonas viridans]
MNATKILILCCITLSYSANAALIMDCTAGPSVNHSNTHWVHIFWDFTDELLMDGVVTRMEYDDNGGISDYDVFTLDFVNATNYQQSYHLYSSYTPWQVWVVANATLYRYEYFPFPIQNFLPVASEEANHQDNCFKVTTVTAL